MNTPAYKPGLFGRGPAFWAVMFMTTAALLGLLVGTGAVDHKGAILALMAVPASLLFAVALAANNKAKHNAGTGKNTAQARYIKRVAIFTSLYLATFAALTFLDAGFEIPGAARFVLALLPGLAVSGFFWAIGRLIVEEEDEFIRMLVIRQSLIASALALSCASIWGFLEAADVVQHIDAYWFAIVWFFGLAVGSVFNRVQYGTWGSI